MRTGFGIIAVRGTLLLRQFQSNNRRNNLMQTYTDRQRIDEIGGQVYGGTTVLRPILAT